MSDSNQKKITVQLPDGTTREVTVEVQKYSFNAHRALAAMLLGMVTMVGQAWLIAGVFQKLDGPPQQDGPHGPGCRCPS